MGLHSNEDELCDPRRYTFGHGRRYVMVISPQTRIPLTSVFHITLNGSICPGRFLRDSSIWLVIASVTASFDMCRPHAPLGSVRSLEPEFLSGFIRYAGESQLVRPVVLTRDRRPKPFDCIIRPRSGQKAELITRSFLDCGA